MSTSTNGASAAESNSAPSEPSHESEPSYEKPVQEQELRADLEEVWQDESPSTARHTDIADEVDGRLGTRSRPNDGT